MHLTPGVAKKEGWGYAYCNGKSVCVLGRKTCVMGQASVTAMALQLCCLQWVAIFEFHHYTMPVIVDGLRHREAIVMHHLLVQRQNNNI